MGYTNSSLVVYTKLSPNHSGQRNHAIDRITPHCVVGQCTAEGLGDWFAKSSTQASSNYGIDKNGRVGMYVEEKNRSWCTSSGANDHRAVTIECASDTTEPYAFRDVVYERLIDLCVDICKRNGKNKLIWFGDKDKTLNYSPASGEMILTVHRWFANKSCPGNWMFARMGDLASKVTARLGGTSTQPETPATNDSFPAVPFLVNVIIDDLNIRTSAGMGNNLTGKYTGKGTFTIVEVQNGWGKLKSGAGWIYLENPSYCTIGKSVASTTTPEPAKPVVTGTASTEADAKTIWDSLMVWINNEFGVAGLMGNLYAESGLRSNNLQNTYEKSLGLTDEQYTAKVDSGEYTNFIKDSAGYGLAQWTYWSRKQMFKEFADWLNTSIGDLQMQLSFLQKEITQNYASMLKTLQGAKSVKEASDAVLTIYERPADQGDTVKSKRASYGQKYYDQFHHKESVEPATKVMYYVQVGAYSKKENADAQLKKAKEAGFTDAFIKEG